MNLIFLSQPHSLRQQTMPSLLSYRVVSFFVASADVVVIIASSITGRLAYDLATGARFGHIGEAIGVGLLSSIIFVFLLQSICFYRLAILTRPLRFLGRICVCSLLVCLAITAILFLIKQGSDFSRGAFLAFTIVQLVGLGSLRLFIGAKLSSMMARGAIVGQPVVVIGEKDELDRLQANYLLQSFGFKDVGRFVLGDERSAGAGCFEAAIEWGRHSKAEAYVVATAWSNADRIASINASLRTSPLPVILLPDHIVRCVIGQQSAIGVGNALTVELQRAPMSLKELITKRLLDIVGSGFALVLLAPVFVVAAMAIRFDGPGRIIFRQHRNGFNQRPFAIYKFRTMAESEDGASVTQARRGDHRVTRVGRFLRRTSIDELPQLLNVFKGQMSLVGPRPHALAHDKAYNALIEEYCMRHHVKPGITGWAQVNGHRGETKTVEEMKARIELDMWYINNRSILLDLAILTRTCFEVLQQDAY